LESEFNIATLQDNEIEIAIEVALDLRCKALKLAPKRGRPHILCRHECQCSRGPQPPTNLALHNIRPATAKFYVEHPGRF
jgi:hypothetical protein